MDVGSLLLSAETQAARVEGILLADPALAALWRMETSLLEAAASVGLEGERISTQGMVLRLTSGTAMEEDARAAEMALKVLTVIRRPGDPFGEPVASLAGSKRLPRPSGRHATRAIVSRMRSCPWSWRPLALGPTFRSWRDGARRPAMPSVPGAAARWPSGSSSWLWKVPRVTCRDCLPIRGLVAMRLMRGQGAC